MKTLFLLFTLLLSGNSFSLGDTSVLPASPEAMTDTVGTLNQVTEETDRGRNLGPQDQQEKQYQQQKEREEKEWNDSRSPPVKELGGRFDEPEE